MHVPIIASLSEIANNVIANPASPAAETPEATYSWRRPRTFRKYGRPSSFRHQHDDASRAAPAEAEAEDFGLEERAWTCPRGRAFYRCSHGFQGCCSHDPCHVSRPIGDRVHSQHRGCHADVCQTLFACILCLRHLLTLLRTVLAWRIMSRWSERKYSKGEHADCDTC